jgi:hypothetical protein
MSCIYPQYNNNKKYKIKLNRKTKIKRKPDAYLECKPRKAGVFRNREVDKGKFCRSIY